MQIFTAFEASPGEADGLAFDLESIGLYARRELIQARIAFTAPAEGARGGSVAFVQRTPAGLCRVSIETSEGLLPEQIAGRLYSAVMDMTYPGTRQCESRHNTYDLQLENGGIITSSALGVSIEIQDPGVGLSVSPL
jgi:hypothetical protein